MKRIRIIHRLRTALALLGFLAVISAGVVLWWANSTGLPDAWRTEIERTLARHGLNAEIESLRFNPLRGIEANGVTLFTDATKVRALSRIGRLVLDLDRARLARGDFRVDRLELAGAGLSILADPTAADSPALEILDAHGKIEIGPERHLRITEGRGEIGGIELDFEVDFLTWQPVADPDPEAEAAALEFRRKLLTTVLEIQRTWSPRGEAPLLLTLRGDGDLEDPDSLRLEMRLSGAAFTTHGQLIDSLLLHAQLRGPNLVIDQAEIRAAGGRLIGRGEYDLEGRHGRFRADSTLDPRSMLQGLALPVPKMLPELADAPAIQLQGEFEETQDGWRQNLIGTLDLMKPSLEHLSADRLSTAFSWDGSRLFLEDLRIEDGPHALDGRAFIAPQKILYEIRSDLPIRFWQRSVRFHPLDDVLADFNEGQNSATRVNATGHANPEVPSDWSFRGEAEANNFKFRGVPARRAKVTMDLNTHALDFTRGEAEFDFTDYGLRRAHQGPTSGTLAVDRVRYDTAPKRVVVENVRGEVWPAPVVRTFAPALADDLEIYRFHRRPTLSAGGSVDVSRGGGNHDLRVAFTTEGAAGYDFLNHELQLDAPSGTVHVLPGRVDVQGLDFGLYGGRVRADMSYSEETRQLAGAMDWTEVSMPDLAGVLELDSQPEGELTGRIEFTQGEGGIAGLDGHGHLALEGGEFFDVPIFGPLSGLVAAVLGNRNAGFQEISDVFFTFDVAKGVVSTGDLLATTSSLILTGDGVADLNRRKFLMTIRMNARGFLGIITLPLKPFYGLFQFRGFGPMSDPQWKRVGFTSPPEVQERILLAPPKAHPVPGPQILEPGGSKR